eukprot:CAMPEP_0180667102 /NCGR_PEP_ID=MMETSP1037_2-20121125/62186_1 /TAXON_ID=632150 /ORGANISM="Azadinium spinosum, Strain 3D9" /LENGTH=37 /DNA_ID= /DNA_START= /DNA_END= /DNA_ORIENTATION=
MRGLVAQVRAKRDADLAAIRMEAEFLTKDAHCSRVRQ